MQLILTYTKPNLRIWVHSPSSSLFPTEFGQHCLAVECPEIVRVMQASHYAVIHLRYVTKTLILGGESDAKPAHDAGKGWCHPSLQRQERGPIQLTVFMTFVFYMFTRTSGHPNVRHNP